MASKLGRENTLLCDRTGKPRETLSKLNMYMRRNMFVAVGFSYHQNCQGIPVAILRLILCFGLSSRFFVLLSGNRVGCSLWLFEVLL